MCWSQLAQIIKVELGCQLRELKASITNNVVGLLIGCDQQPSPSTECRTWVFTSYCLAWSKCFNYFAIAVISGSGYVQDQSITDEGYYYKVTKMFASSTMNLATQISPSTQSFAKFLQSLICKQYLFAWTWTFYQSMSKLFEAKCFNYFVVIFPNELEFYFLRKIAPKIFGFKQLWHCLVKTPTSSKMSNPSHTKIFGKKINFVVIFRALATVQTHSF